jgi:hypothetical protein
MPQFKKIHCAGIAKRNYVIIVSNNIKLYNNKFRELYNNFHFTDIEEGLKITIKWFLLNYPNIRI